jgi:hypothetical protein
VDLTLLYKKDYVTKPLQPIDIQLPATNAKTLVVAVDMAGAKPSWKNAGKVSQLYIGTNGAMVESNPVSVDLGQPTSVSITAFGALKLRFYPNTWISRFTLSVYVQPVDIPSHTHSIQQIDGLTDLLAAPSVASISGLQTALDGKSPIGHSHVIGDVTGLQTALDGKALSIHNHAIGDVTGLQTAITDLYSPLLSFPYGANDYKYPVIGATPAQATFTQNLIVWTPFFNPSSFAANTIGFRCWQNPGGFFRVGFYQMGADASPSNLLWDSGAIDASVASWKDIARPLSLNRGWYWIATVTGGGVQLILSQQMYYPLGVAETGSTLATVGYGIASAFANGLPSVAPTKASLLNQTSLVVNTRTPYFRYK